MNSDAGRLSRPGGVGDEPRLPSGIARIPGDDARLNAVIGLLRDVRDIIAFEADAFDSSRCADTVAMIDEFMGWGR